MTQLVSLKDKVDSVRKLLQEAKPQIVMALPRHMSGDRMLRIAMTSIARNPKLLDCTPHSLIGAIIQSAQLGLEPDDLRGHGFLVPFWNSRKGKSEVQFLPGYKGLCHLARSSGAISTIEAREVHAKDTFKFGYGLKPFLNHVPGGELDDASITYFYAICRLKDGGVQFEVMTKAEVEEVRNRYSAAWKRDGSGPWKEEFAEMGKKTVLRRLCKMLPASAELAAAVSLDELHESGIPQELGEVIALDVPSGEESEKKGKLDTLTETMKRNGGEAEAPPAQGASVKPGPSAAPDPPVEGVRQPVGGASESPLDYWFRMIAESKTAIGLEQWWTPFAKKGGRLYEFDPEHRAKLIAAKKAREGELQ